MAGQKPMPPEMAEEMAGGEAPEMEAGPKGGASELVAEINDKMMMLMDLMDQSQAVDDEDKQALAALIQGYQSFVQNNLAAAPGQKQPQAKPAPGPTSMEAGVAQAKPMMG